MSAGLHVDASLKIDRGDARLDPVKRRPGDRDGAVGTLYPESAGG